MSKRKAKYPSLKRVEPLLQKLHDVQSELNDRVLERTEETKGILLAALSGTSALFLGDVGTGKTFHVTLASTLLGMSNFDILLSETTKPDQIFGPADVPALAQGRQQYKYQGYAPSCEVLFFDEIFKANAAVLNPLLWIVNENIFRDGDNGVIKCPTKAVFAASNEIPTDPILKAIYDRFILRYNVEYVKTEDSHHKLIDQMMEKRPEPKPILSSPEVDKLREAVLSIEFPNPMRELSIKMRNHVEMGMGYKLSDRRYVRALEVTRAHALLRGSPTVEEIDLEVMSHICWNEPEQAQRVGAIIFSSTAGDTVEVTSYLERVHEINTNLKVSHNLDKAINELRFLYSKLKSFSSRYAQRCAEEALAVGLRVRGLIDGRKAMQGIIVQNANSQKVFKMHPQSALYWTAEELRQYGFKQRRKGATYWWHASPNALKARLSNKGIRLEISNEVDVSGQ